MKNLLEIRRDSSTTETRTFAAAELRLIDPSDGEKMPKLVGYAAVFGVPSRIMGKGETRFVEVIKKGAFAKSLAAGADVRALWDHETASVLGRTKSGTLKLSEDDKGLRFECQPPDTQVGRDAVASIRRGDVDGMSFGFRKIADDWSKNSDGMMVRTLIEVEPFDVSPTAFPCYEGTDIDLRSIPGAAVAVNKITGKTLPAIERRDLSMTFTTDVSLTDQCNWIRQSCRNLFDNLQGLISCISNAEGDPTDADMQAAHDLQDEIEDLCGKCVQADAALTALVGPDPEEAVVRSANDTHRRRLELLSAELRMGTPGEDDADTATLNDADVKFLKTMIPLHRQEANAVTAYLHDGKDSRVEAFAKTIQTDTQAELKKMTGWLKAAGVAEADPSKKE